MIQAHVMLPQSLEAGQITTNGMGFQPCSSLSVLPLEDRNAYPFHCILEVVLFRVWQLRVCFEDLWRCFRV